MIDKQSDDKLNIAIIIDTFYPTIDGPVHLTNQYAKRLNTSDNCTVFCPQRKDYQDTITDYEIVRCKAFKVPVIKYDCATPRNDKQLRQSFIDGNYDIIHAHSPFLLGRYGSKIAKELDIPMVATLHTKYYDDFKRFLKVPALARHMLKGVVKFYEGVDEVWTVNTAMIDTFREYGYKGDIHVLGNGTEYRYPQNAAELLQRVNQTYNLSPDEPVFFYIGQITLQKNLKLTIESCKIIKDSGLKFKMIMVGTGYNEKQLKEYASELGLDDTIIFTGRIADRELISGLYLRSSMVLFPSLYDTSSLVIIEAAAHKVPIILIDGATTAENINPDHNGFLAQNNAQSFAQKIIDSMADKALMDKVSKNAHKELYANWDDVLKSVRERYEYVIDKHKTLSRTVISAVTV